MCLIDNKPHKKVTLSFVSLYFVSAYSYPNCPKKIAAVTTKALLYSLTDHLLLMLTCVYGTGIIPSFIIVVLCTYYPSLYILINIAFFQLLCLFPFLLLPTISSLKVLSLLSHIIWTNHLCSYESE